jgi:small-conductance mechanosensitive channel
LDQLIQLSNGKEVEGNAAGMDIGITLLKNNAHRLAFAISLPLLVLLSACTTQPQSVGDVLQAEGTSDIDSAGSLSEPTSGGLVEEPPERTPVPTPTPGPVDRVITTALEETELAGTVFLGLTIESWIDIGISILTFVLLYLLGLWLIRRPLTALVKRSPTEIDDAFLPTIQGPLKALVAVFSLDFSINRLGFWNTSFRQTLGDIFFILYLLIIAYIIWQLVLFMKEWYRDEMVSKMGEERYKAVSPLILRMVSVILLVFALAILLDHFGFDLSAITIIAVLIFLVYIAARDVLSDAMNGFIILFDQPFRVGDRIKTLQMDTWGDVVDIGTRTTRIQTYDNRLVVIPNSDIANQQLDNYTYPDPTYRMQLDIGIQYGSDISMVQESLTEAIANVEGILPDKPIEVLLIEFGESGLIFRVRWWVVTQTDFYVMSNQVNLAMIEALGEAGIEISFTTFNVVNLQPGSVESRNLFNPPKVEPLS